MSTQLSSAQLAAEVARLRAETQLVLRMAGLNDFAAAPVDAATATAALRAGLEEALDIRLRPGPLTAAEAGRWRDLTTTKYASEAWTLRK